MSAIRSLLNNSGVRNLIRRSYHDAGSHRYPNMNDLPVPRGSWKSNHDANNSKYNMHLIVGVAFLAITIGVAKGSGLVYLNYYPPRCPAEKYDD